MPGRPINENKKMAELFGEPTYVGSEHGCGTSDRYTKTGSCVFCARRKQREGREARLAAQTAATINASHEMTDAEAADHTLVEEMLDSESEVKYPEVWD